MQDPAAHLRAVPPAPIPAPRIAWRAMAAIAGFLAAHVLTMLALPGYQLGISTVYQVAATLLPVPGVWQALRRSPPRQRIGWAYLLATCLLTTGNTLACYWIYGVAGYAYDTANITDFLYLFNYIFMVLLVMWHEDRYVARDYFVIDGLVAVIGLGLGYILLFRAMPFSGQRLNPVSGKEVITAFTVMNMALASFATLRWLGQERVRPRPSYERVMVTFILPMALCMMAYDALVGSEVGWVDFLEDAPFLSLWAGLRAPLVLPRENAVKSPLSLLVGSLGPALAAGTVMCLGLVVGQKNPMVGGVAAMVTLTLFALRGALAQTRYIAIRRALELKQARLERQSLLDGLTELANRRCFDAKLRGHMALALRGDRPLALLMVDIDHFKRLNDTLGHPAGDACLVSVAEALRMAVRREADVVARYGGEEFAVILPDTDSLGAWIVAEAVLEEIQALDLPNPGVPSGLVTVSIGLACLETSGARDESQLVETADRALYAAKNAGRNRICQAPLRATSQ